MSDTHKAVRAQVVVIVAAYSDEVAADAAERIPRALASAGFHGMDLLLVTDNPEHMARLCKASGFVDELVIEAAQPAIIEGRDHVASSTTSR